MCVCFVVVEFRLLCRPVGGACIVSCTLIYSDPAVCSTRLSGSILPSECVTVLKDLEDGDDPSVPDREVTSLWGSVLCNVGLCKWSLADSDGAVANLRQALRKDPSSSFAREAVREVRGYGHTDPFKPINSLPCCPSWLGFSTYPLVMVSSVHP